MATALLVAVAGTTLAQSSATAEVSANVQAELTIVNDVAIDFGNISATSTPILDPKGVANTDVGQSYTVGQFTIGGSNGVGVGVSWDATVTLGDGTNTITYTPVISGDASDQAQSASTILTSGDVVALGATGYTLWVGGNLGTLSSQPVGQYTATATNGSGAFTVTVEYN